MKRVKVIEATDRDLSVNIRISISGKRLTRGEMDDAIHSAASHCIKAIGKMHYLSVWPSQVKVK